MKLTSIIDIGPDMYYHPPSESEERERFLPPPRQQGSGLIRPKATKPMMIPVDTQPPPRERKYNMYVFPQDS